MDCEEAKRLLEEGQDGLLETPESRRLEEHLAACPACRRERDALAALDAALADALPVQAPPYLAAAVMRKVRAESGARRVAEAAGVAVGTAVALTAAAIAVAHGLREAAQIVGEPLGRSVVGAARELGSRVAHYAGTPGLQASWAGSSGAQGVLTGLSIAAVAFLVLTALRLARRHAFEWR
jgi:predicted anti-sigma-YlaC factor YlaD